MNKYHKFFNWHYTRWGGFFVVNTFRLWTIIHRKRVITVDVKNIKRDQPIVFASNHMSFFDPPAIFSALGVYDQLKFSPVKFMTSRRYYYSALWPLLYTTGGFPHKGNGKTGVEGALLYANEGYSIFMFPEGKLNRNYDFSHAYPGTNRILDRLEDPRLYLVNIYWQKRQSILSRPLLRINIVEADKTFKNYSSDKIMKEIYKLPDKHGLK